ncbi:hypothetical protein JD969_06805 [Planctomycetota bacterium]|nr:hypothetical protein JD969_06805 [Planctomycetota bacterium]
MERVFFHRRVDLKAGWLTSQRHGFLATRHQSLALMLTIGLLLLAPIVWGWQMMMFAESQLGWWSGLAIGSLAMLGLLGFYLYRYIRYRMMGIEERSQWGDLLTQEITLNRHGVRFTQTGMPQRFYPWWQVGFVWQKRRLDLHLFMVGLVLHLKYSDLSPKQIDQIRAWIEASSSPYSRCKKCGYDLRGSNGPSCPECGHDMPAEHIPSF